MPGGAYWRKRMEALEQQRHNKTEEYFRMAEKQFRMAQANMEKEIAVWYERLSENNEISLTAAYKLLRADELEEFHWTVEEYIKKGESLKYSDQWKAQLENASAKVHIRRLEALKIQIRQQCEMLYGSLNESTGRMLQDIYKDQYYRMAYEIQKGTGVGYAFNRLDTRRIWNAVDTAWAQDGKNFSSRIWQDRERLVNSLNEVLTQSIIQGEDPRKAIERLSKKMNTSKSNAGRLYMTESAAIASRGQEQCYNELGVEEFEFVCTLDTHTSEICRRMDGRHFPMAQYEIGVTAPPMHPYCRSVTAPYFPDDEAVGKRAARGGDGKTYYVPSDMTYEEWKKAFVDDGDKSGLQDISSDATINTNSWTGVNYVHSYTKKTAIKRLKDEYGIDFLDSEKYSMDEVLLSDSVEWLDSFKAQYGVFMEKNPCEIPVIINKAPSKMKGSIGYYKHYVNDSGVVELALNGRYHSDIEAFQEYIEQSIKSKWYPQNATVHKTFVHEFGHHVSNSMRWMMDNPNWQHEFIQECIDDFKKIEPDYTYTKDIFDGMGEYVSRYGARSESELFAEAFAEYFGGENPREFAKIFGRKLDKLLKGVK